jgi:general L-amino acid transport system substrate-binding protein
VRTRTDATPRRRHTRAWLAGGLALALTLSACADEDAEPDDPADEAAEGDEADPDLDIDDDADDAAAGSPTDDGGSLLDQVRDAGEVTCGVNDAVPGFGVTTEDGDFEGFDIDFCRAIAAAVLGDAEAVNLVPLTAEARFTALQSGEIDVLVRNTTWTAARDGGEGGAFVTTTFYDGQGMMVPADAGIESIDDMEGAAVCVLSGTTTEMNLETEFASRGLSYEAATFEDNDTLQEAFLSDRCDGWTSDRSQLAAVRSDLPDGPDSAVILDEVISKEPLGPAVADGDSQWFDAVNWTVIATMLGEELGVDSSNVEDLVESVDVDEEPALASFLGQSGADPGLGLEEGFAVDVISQVGNYAEIFERNVGPDTGLGLERDQNALYTDGGLHYPPPL